MKILSSEAFSRQTLSTWRHSRNGTVAVFSSCVLTNDFIIHAGSFSICSTTVVCPSLPTSKRTNTHTHTYTHLNILLWHFGMCEWWTSVSEKVKLRALLGPIKWNVMNAYCRIIATGITGLKLKGIWSFCFASEYNMMHADVNASSIWTSLRAQTKAMPTKSLR